MFRTRLGNGGLLLATLLLTAACGDDGSSEEGAALDRVTPYAVVCTQTECHKQTADCMASEAEQCNDCYDSCRSPYGDAALCASICNDICSTSDCGSCSAPADQCDTWGVRFEPPPVNAQILDLASRELKLCASDSSSANDALSVDFDARLLRHEYATAFECVLAKGCASIDECTAPFPDSGNVGTALCARQQACGTLCVFGDEDYMNSNESILRPPLVAELNRCARETDCGIAIACWSALRPIFFPNYTPNP